SGGHPIGERRLLEEGSTGKLRQHPLVLHAHAPGDIGLPRLIWSPSAAIERADEPHRREKEEGRKNPAAGAGGAEQAHGVAIMPEPLARVSSSRPMRHG